jgi:predicted nucleic acid-binding protein
MTTYLLDTNILSAVIRKEARADQRFRQAVDDDDILLLSVVVFYEIRRGLLKRDARKQMITLEHLANQLAWCDVIQGDWEQAAWMWVERAKIGKPIADADVLIAAQAKRLEAILVTDNEKDFDSLGITVENWRKA